MALQNNNEIGVLDPDALPGSLVRTGAGVVLGYALGNYANDTAAATGGVPVGGLYRNGSVLMIRVS